MAALRSTLEALGWKDERQQIALVRLLAFCDRNDRAGLPMRIWGNLPGAHQARAFMNDGRLFRSDAQALEWLRDATQELFYSTQDYAAVRNAKGFYATQREIIMPLLTELGLTGARMPVRDAFDHVLLYGSNESSSISKIGYLEELLQGGLQAGEIVLLGSNRLLSPEIERESLTTLLCRTLSDNGAPLKREEVEHIIKEAVEDPVIGNIGDFYERNIAQAKQVLEKTGLRFRHWPTEADMLELHYDRMCETLPAGGASIPCRTIRSPMICKSDGSPVHENTEETLQRFLNGELRRANTFDTLCDFARLDGGAGKGSVLAVSQQPYALHQHGQMRAALPQERFPVVETTVKRMVAKDVNIHHALGCLAKYIYASHDRAQEKLAARNAPQRGA